MAKRKRRGYTNEFKAETVRLIRESGKCIAVVARELDLTERVRCGPGSGRPGSMRATGRPAPSRTRNGRNSGACGAKF
jgi:transposase-like protein